MDHFSIKSRLFRSLPFLLLFFVYGIFTYPCIYWGDSGEFSYVATFLGIPHPTGYPLYTQALRLFSSIPIGSPYYLHNLFSALMAVLGIALLYKICFRVTGSPTSSWIATFYFALSPTFLMRAGLAEVYTMEVFIVLGLTYLGLSLLHEWDTRKFWTMAFLSGLGLSHHLITTMSFPALLYILLTAPKEARRLRLYGGSVLFGLCGLLPYFFIAIRSHSSPAFSYPQLFGISMSSWRDWYWLISGEIFRPEMSSFSLKKHIEDFGFFFFLLFKDFYWVGGVLGLLGLVKEAKNFSRSFIFLALLFFIQAAALIHYNVPDVAEFYVMAFSLWTPWMAVGLHQVGSSLQNARSKKYPFSKKGITVSYLLLIFPVWGLFQLYQPLSLNQTPLAYVHRVLSYPQSNFSLFTTYTGRDIFRLFRFLTPARPDVTVIDYGLDLLKERSRMIKVDDPLSPTFSNRLRANNTQLMEKMVSDHLRNHPVYFSREEWFLTDKFSQKKVFDSFNAVTLKPLPAVMDSLPTPVRPVGLVFGSALKLVGYALDPIPIMEGELFTLRLYWQKIKDISGDITALLIFQNKKAPHSLSPLDHFFSQLTLGYGFWSPADWPIGKIIEERYQITAPTLNTSPYNMYIALFDKKTFEHQPIQNIPKSFSLIGETTVVANPELKHYWDK